MRLNQVILILFFLLYSCSNSERQSISGSINGLEDQTVVLSEIGVREIVWVDSVRTDGNGNFLFNPEPTDESLYLLDFANGEQLVLALSPGEKLSIEGKAAVITSLVVADSEESQFYLDYQKHTYRNREYIDSVAAVIRTKSASAYGENLQHARALIDSVFDEQRKKAAEYIRAHPSSLASLVVLNQRFGRTPLFNETDDFDLYLTVDSALMARIPQNKHSADHHLRVLTIKRQKEEKRRAEERLQTGKVIPDLVLPDTSGKKINLHSLQGSKVLVYFWSAMDGTSRQTNRKLSKPPTSMKEDLKIYAVSLDQNRDLWKAAIKLDGLHWINVNESDGFYSPLVRLYDVPAQLPYFILLDEQSRILYRGKELDMALDKVNVAFNCES